MDYVDANIIIYAISDSTQKGENARKLLLKENLATCTLTLDEVGDYYFKENPKTAAENLKNLTQSPRITWMPFSHEHYDEFIQLVRQGIRPRDAIHASVAIKQKATILWSEDKDFDQIKNLKRKTPW